MWPGFRGFRGFGLPLAGWFRGCRIALRAMLIKSALRDDLAVSYGIISILRIGSLRSPPPIRLRRTSPVQGQNKTPRNTFFINGSTVSTGYCATVEVLHRTSKWGEVRRLACPLRRFPFAAPPNCGGKVVAPATKGGMPEWYMKYMTLCFSPQISYFPLRWQGNWIHRGEKRPANPVTRFPMGEMPRSGKRVYRAEQRCDTLSLSRLLRV